MCLQNQTFLAQTETENRKKLEIVLRQLAGGRLTARQRQMIAQAVGCYRQYSFALCRTADAFMAIAAPCGGQTVTRRIFGDVAAEPGTPVALLVQQSTQGGESHTVYIYLPEEKEEQGDDTRKEEKPAQ